MAHIKRINLQGFKSFNNKYEFETPKGFVCITGPNGSGKSNVFDSVAFVLGELSSKDLRTQNLASLIYNGGLTGKPAQRAKVTIVFDNSERAMSVDSDEVVVSREVNKNGQGTYRINGQMATRSRILDLLDETGIDPDGYSVIKQGQVARFVDMSETDRLKIIENISGISSYEDKKAKAEKELEKVENKLSEARIILNEKQERLREIEKEKRQAERFNEIVNRVKILKASMLGKEIKELNDDIEGFRESIKNLESRREEAKSSVHEIVRLMKKLEEEYAKTDEEIRKKGGKDKATLAKELEDLKENRGELRINFFTGNREIKKIESQIRDLDKKSSVVKQDLTVAGREKKKIETELKQKEKYLEKIERANSDSLKKNDKIFELQLRFNSVSNDVIKKKSESSRVSRLADYESRKEELVKKRTGLKNELAGLEQALNEVLEEESRISGKVGSLRNNVNNKSRELAGLESRKQTFQRTTSFSVKKILESKNSIPGIHGTVEELCGIPEQYSLPLRVAMGRGKDFIVVEDESVAYRCVEFLKEKKLGVATFMPLNRIEQKQVTRYINDPGNVGYALDMVSFNQKYYGVFSNVLFDTLIVNDFEATRRIGFGRNRMVTLDGTEISRGGTVTGGYRKGFNMAGLENNIASLKSDLLLQEKELSEMISEKEVLTEQIISMREKRGALETRVESVESELSTISGELSKAGRHDEIISEIKKLEDQKQKISDEIESLKDINDSEIRTEYEKLVENVNELRVGFNTFDTRISNILEPELDSIKQAYNVLSAEKNDLTEKVRESNKRLGELQKDIDSKQKVFETLDSTIDTLYARRNRVSKRLEREEKRKSDRNERIKSIDEQITKRDVRLADKLGRYEALLKQFKEFEGVEIIRLVNMEERDKELKNLEKEITNFGPVNQRAVEMYEDVRKEFDTINGKYEHLRNEKNDVLLLIDEVESRKTGAFLKAYNEVASNFERVFEQLTSGKGHLELTDDEKPLDGGVDVRVRTKEGKSFTHVRSLSGGEKTITALAFIFAIQEFYSTPFYIFDEIDAALDKENSEKLSELLEKYSKKSQIIIISHNDAIITRADYLYGVSMNKLGESSVVGIKLPK